MTKKEYKRKKAAFSNKVFNGMKKNFQKASELIDNATLKQPFKVGNKEFFICEYAANFRLDEVGRGLLAEGGKENLKCVLATVMAYMDLGVKYE